MYSESMRLNDQSSFFLLYIFNIILFRYNFDICCFFVFVVYFFYRSLSCASPTNQVGDQFMANIEQVAANVPYMVSVGNHENSAGNLVCIQ